MIVTKKSIISNINQIISQLHQPTSKDLLKIIRWVMRKGYDHFSADEQETIALKAREFITEDSIVSTFNSVMISTILGSELKQLTDELPDEIDLVGFIRFRCPRYLAAVECLVDKVSDLCCKEWEEEAFVEVLKGIVNMTKSKTNIAIIHPGPDRHIITIDDCVDYTEAIFQTPAYTNFSRDDILLNTLINLAPLRVVVYDEELLDPAIARVLRSIFGYEVGGKDGTNT